MSHEYDRTTRNRVRRVPSRGHYDRDTVYAVVDAAWIGHVAFACATTEEVTVIPMLHARDGDELIFHGARSSRLMKLLASGAALSVGFTLVDGLVLAKSMFHHSMNYRSAVVFGTGRLVDSRDDKLEALRLLSEKILPGRWEDARQPTDRELAATAVVRVQIETASAKIRAGDPIDEAADLELPIWSGVLPLVEQTREPISDSHSGSLPIPDYVETFRHPRDERRQLELRDSINDTCPRSGKPVAADSLATYRGATVGFCNPNCRDDFAANLEERPRDREFFDAILARNG